MTVDDMVAIERQCSAIRSISPMIRRPDVRVSYGKQEVPIPLEGVAATYHAIRNFPVGIGRPFSPVDVEQSHHVCVLGREVLKKLKAEDDILGQHLLIKGQRFTVIG